MDTKPVYQRKLQNHERQQGQIFLASADFLRMVYACICISKLELSVDIAEAQNYFFSKIVNNIEEMIQNMTCSADRELVTLLFEIGENLNINMDYYKQQFNKALVRNKG